MSRLFSVRIEKNKKVEYLNNNKTEISCRKSSRLLVGVPTFASDILNGASESFGWMSDLATDNWKIIAVIAVALSSAFVARKLLRKNIVNHADWIGYLVKEEDNISSLASRCRIDWKDLANINRLKAPYILKTGQTILLPPEAGSGSEVASLNPEEKAEDFIVTQSSSLASRVTQSPDQLFYIRSFFLAGLGLVALVALVWPIGSWLLVWRNQSHQPKKISIDNLEIPPRSAPQVSVESIGSDTASGSGNQAIGEEKEEATNGSNQDIKKLKISVLNGGAPVGAAGKISKLIAGSGYSEPTARNAASDQHSGQAVYYSDDIQAEAAKIRDMLKSQYPDILLKVAVSAEEKSADIVVMLGK